MGARRRRRTPSLLDGAGERGLCAGGDVVAIYHSAKADGAEARQFWYDEYLLNAQIGRYPKPYVALMDGIVMGGGVGVSAHGSVRVVTDTTKMAMPEVGIGFIPDVGGTYLLSRAPGLLGLHAALTGAPFSGADAIAMGFADHYRAARRARPPSRARSSPTASTPHWPRTPSSRRASPLLAQRHWIDECYAGDTVADIVAALRGHDAGPANDAANLIASRSPDRAGRDARGGPPRRQAGHPGRRAAPGVSDVVRGAAFARPRRGHPRPAHRQGPQPEVVAAVAGRRHRRRRRGLLRPRRPRPDLPEEEQP